MTPNLSAFLTLISHAEGTDRAIDPDTHLLVDPYRVCFKGQDRPMHIIQSLATHPAVSGEWHGEKLDFLGPGYAGEWSTAAGRLQIRKQTFLELSAILHTTSFAPDVQDDMGVQLIKRHGALDLVNQGEIGKAIALCNREWASLPGSKANQPQAKFSALEQAYTNAGGTLA